MASKKKTFSPKSKRDDDPAVYAEFMASVLDGTVKATDCIEVRKGNGKLQLDYDDPNG